MSELFKIIAFVAKPCVHYMVRGYAQFDKSTSRDVLPTERQTKLLASIANASERDSR